MDACHNLESAMAEAQYQHNQATTTGQSSAGGDPTTTALTYLSFLEKKIGYLRGIVLSAAPRQIVSAELSCIAVQLVSISDSLAAAAATADQHDEDAVAKHSSPPPAALFFAGTAHEKGDSDEDYSSNHDLHYSGIRGDHRAAADDDDDDGSVRVPSSYEVIQLDEEEILAPHVHTCKVCGKGFKRDANLRMHMRGHGDEYKTLAALAKPAAPPSSSSSPATNRRLCFYSCPYAGCKRNREHRNFQPLKTAVCVKNHYRRSHCDKGYVCRRCGVKRFSVLADLRTHEKHCGRDRWTCSCGTSFSRKDKLFGHVAAFDGHAPALPPEPEEGDENAAANNGGSGGSSTDQLLMMDNTETVAGGGIMRSIECFSDNVFGDTSFNDCADDVKGFAFPDDARCLLEDARGLHHQSTTMSLDSCDFDGLDLFGAPAGFEFGNANMMEF